MNVSHTCVKSFSYMYKESVLADLDGHESCNVQIIM